MCGIAGIAGPLGPEAAADKIGRMLTAMAHRGPDGDGLWQDPTGGCSLGHKRLAIIDPEGGHQPLCNEDQTIWVTFNGCIYNYRDLARELRQRGHRLRTHSDTEVIVHAYEEWGDQCVNRFNGMWAFGLWDSRKRRLFCSRDRVGVKPFYFSNHGDTFTFASEIKALLAGGAVDASVNPTGLRQYLCFQFCLDQTTLFENVTKLPPGHNLIWEPGGEPIISRYWNIEFAIDDAHDEDYFVDRLKWLLESAVRLRLVSDVELGAHLSGGMDSSAVVGLSRLLLGDTPLKTFTGAFDEGHAFDETRHAKLVAEAAGTEYLETFITPQDFTDSIEKIIWHMDEPAAGPGVFPQYFLNKLAKDHVKVVLGGQGGDEIFIGYARYLVAYLEECLKGAIQDTADRADYVVTLGTIIPSLPTLENYVPMLKEFWRKGLFEDGTRRYFRLMNRLPASRGLLAPEHQDPNEQTFEEFRAVFEAPGPAAKINRILNFDTQTHLQALLHVEDRTSMAWGIESRVPLLDYRLIELMVSVPPDIKFRNGQLKHIFKRTVKNLVPEPIIKRRDKMGFPVPLNKWLAGPLRDFVADILLSQRSRQRDIFNPAALEEALISEPQFSRAVWGALSLELWHRQFIDNAGDLAA